MRRNCTRYRFPFHEGEFTSFQGIPVQIEVVRGHRIVLRPLERSPNLGKPQVPKVTTEEAKKILAEARADVRKAKGGGLQEGG